MDVWDAALKSYCILVTSFVGRQPRRIDIMTRTVMARDCRLTKLRGPGDLEGTQQSGIAFDLRIANLARDGQLLQHVREVAEGILDADPDECNPAYSMFWQHLKELRKTNIDWSSIS